VLFGLVLRVCFLSLGLSHSLDPHGRHRSEHFAAFSPKDSRLFLICLSSNSSSAPPALMCVCVWVSCTAENLFSEREQDRPEPVLRKSVKYTTLDLTVLQYEPQLSRLCTVYLASVPHSLLVSDNNSSECSYCFGGCYRQC